MFTRWKERLASKNAKKQAVEESRKWKNNWKLQDCLHAMRGSCTVAPMDMHEAAVTTVNIAIRDGIWAEADALPEEFFSGSVYIVWDDAALPVLRVMWAAAAENLKWIRIVESNAFIVAETMDRILWFGAHDRISLYDIT